MTLTTTHCACLTPDHHGEEGTDYYATVTDGTRTARLAGPFETHRGAMAALPAAKMTVIKKYAEAAFYRFGTAGVRAA